MRQLEFYEILEDEIETDICFETQEEAERHIKDFQELKPQYGFKKTVFKHTKNVFRNCEEYKTYLEQDEREYALSKLTNREKELLGLKI